MAQNGTNTNSVASSFTFVPTGFLGGLTMFRLSGTQMIIAPGTASLISRHDIVQQSTQVLVQFPNVQPLDSGWLKTNAAWAAGSGNGALDIGAIAANSWYAFFLIYSTGSGVADILCTKEVSGQDPNDLLSLPSNYNRWRYIGSWKTDGSGNWSSIIQTGDNFRFVAPAQDILTTTLGQTNTLFPLASIPLGIKLTAKLRVYCVNPNLASLTLMYCPDEGSPTANAPIGNMNISGTGQAAIASTSEIDMLTDTNAQVGIVSTAANNTIAAVTVGWNDPRGKTI